MDVIRPVMNAELLMLDDLGAETADRMGRRDDEPHRQHTLQRRGFDDLHVELRRHSRLERPNSLLFRVGFRLHSRLHEMCEFLECDGADYRDLPPNAGAEDIYKLWKGQPRRKLPYSRVRVGAAQLREPVRDGKADLKWPGGRAGS